MAQNEVNNQESREYYQREIEILQERIKKINQEKDKIPPDLLWIDSLESYNNTLFYIMGLVAKDFYSNHYKKEYVDTIITHLEEFRDLINRGRT